MSAKVASSAAVEQSFGWIFEFVRVSQSVRSSR